MNRYQNMQQNRLVNGQNTNNSNPLNIFQQMLSMGANPQQVEKLIFAQNPQLEILANQMRQSGLTPIDFVVQYAKQNNIPIEQNAMFNTYQQMLSMIPNNNQNPNK